VHLEIGKTSIMHNEWEDIQFGDFIVLDHCSFIPGEEKGRVMLTVNGRPLFRGKIKDGNIKILEHPLYYEENEIMNPNQHEDDDELEKQFEEESEIEYSEDFDEEDYEEEHEEEDEYDDEEIEESIEEKEEKEEEDVTT